MNPLIEEAVKMFPEAENTYEALTLFEAATFKSLTDFSKELNEELGKQSEKLEQLANRYLAVKVLRKESPVLSIKNGTVK